MLLVNVNTKQFIPAPGSNFIQPVENRDQIILGTRREVRFQLYNPDGTVFALNESDTFCCAGDINFVHTDDLMFYSGHEMCRIIDAAQGIVGVTIDATSDSFADKATSQNTRMYVQLKRHVAGDTLGDTVLQDIVYAQPAVMTTEGAPASSDPEYMTAAATLALLRTAPIYQFSADGEAWHDQQDIAADRFYREQRNGGEWGPAIELIEGKAGPNGAAAGFGTPTIAVETLPAGSDATASVTASGDDTAKVFSFSLGIPKGADGVSSYTYVAYASDASGGGFSRTPSDALKFRAEIHTATAIETPDAEDFAGATWVKYLGVDGTGAGDMTKMVYDTNDDGIVDHAATADAVGATTAAQVADAVGKAHAHANKTTLDKLAETDGKLTFDGSEIGGASNWNDITGKPEAFPPSAHNHAITDVTGLEDALQNAGSVKSVNGQLPDESGNVTVETGSTVDESRLLPALDSVPVGRSGNPVVFKAVSEGMDEHTLLYCPFDADMDDHSNAGGQFVQTGQKSESIVITEKKFGSGCLNCGSGYSFLNGPLAKPVGDVDCTIHFWANFTSFTGKSPFTLLTAAIPDDSNDTSNFGQAAIGCLQLYVSNDLLLLERRTSSNGYTVRIIEASVSLTTGAWNHFAITRSGNIWYLFLNGQLLGTGSDTNVASATHIRIGGDSSAMSGYVDEFLVLDYAKWTTDFKPPTQPATTLTKSYEVSDKGAGAVKSVNGQTPDSSGAVTLPVATASAAGLMTAADKVKLAALQQAATYINTATDFDTYKTAGSYFMKGAVHTNGPLADSYAGTLVVVALAEHQYATQYFTQLYTNKTFVRAYAQDSSTWSSWRRVIVDTDLATTTAAGLMPGDLYSKLINRFTGNPTMPVQNETNLNTLTENGFYTCASCTNAPKANQYLYLMVVRYGTANVFNWQFACDINTGIMYSRRSRSNTTEGTIWDSWRRLLTDVDITESKARPGYFKLPGGTIVQWGAATITNDGLYQVTFPIAFPNAIFIGNATAVSGTADASGVVISISTPQTNRMDLVTKHLSGNNQDINVHWLAIGY